MDYTDHIIRDVLINGIYDSDIRRETLGIPDILTKPVNDVIAIVENKEMARNALPSSTLSAMSSFQRLRRDQKTGPVPIPAPTDRARQASCLGCKSTFKIFTEGSRGWNTKPHQICIGCYRARRQKRRQQPSNDGQQAAMESVPISQISSVQLKARPGRRCGGRRRTQMTHSTIGGPTPIRLGHHIFSRGEWRRAKLRDHPRVLITISVDRSVGPRGSINHRGSDNEVSISAIADTGAQSDLWSLEEFLACGFSRDDLRPVNLSLSAANRSPIAIEGAFFARLSTAPSDSGVTSCRSMVYVSSSVRAMYLSYESLLNLGLFPADFPSGNSGGPRDEHGPGARDIPIKPLFVNATRSADSGCTDQGNPQDAQCSCPKRTAPPPRPQALPFPCSPENNGRMKDWLLEIRLIHIQHLPSSGFALHGGAPYRNARGPSSHAEGMPHRG